MRLKFIVSIIVTIAIVSSVAGIVYLLGIPLYQIQSYEELDSCENADKYLEPDSKSYQEAKRFSTNPSGMTERYQITSLTEKQLSAIKSCGIENLPTLVSFIVEKKVGFLEFFDNALIKKFKKPTHEIKIHCFNPCNYRNYFLCGRNCFSPCCSILSNSIL